MLDSWEKTFVERQVTPASAKYRITWKSEMILMMEKQSMRPNPQAPKESTFARHNLYAEILMQLVHRNLFLVIFDFSFQRRMFLEPSDYEAFTLNCSMYLKFLPQFVWKCSIRQLQTQIVFKNILEEFLRWNAACTGNFCWHSRKFFCYHFHLQPLILILRNASQITFENTLLRISFPKV